MKALMFGWEFPPHILGGLGTASFGLTRGMAMENCQAHQHTGFGTSGAGFYL